jgi:hypothetical protein
MHRAVYLSCGLLIALQGTSRANQVRIDFSGAILNVTGNPFGSGMSASNTVSGFVLYDPAASATHPKNIDDVGYRQQIVGGFSANFGGTF